MKFEHSQTGNWKNAFRGLRHPLESYAKSDSKFGIASVDYFNDIRDDFLHNIYAEEIKNPEKHKELFEFYDINSEIQYDPRFEEYEYALLGPKDLDLAQRMIKAGSPNDKFLRQIFVSVDITAPLYWWKEMDTYKVATVANSTSTMHKLANTPITIDCFETDDYDQDLELIPKGSEQAEDKEVFYFNFGYYAGDIADNIIEDMESLRQKYNETGDIRYWKELIRWLPESWLQTRTWTANYAVLRQIFHWRKSHKLTEWWSFCDWIRSLPYAEQLITFDN